MAVINNTTQAYEYMLDKDVNFIRAAFPIKTDTGIPLSCPLLWVQRLMFNIM
jgi:hypothetical protein